MGSCKSSKQRHLLQFVKRACADPDNRLIIFSLFGATLNQIQQRLHRVGVQCVQCRGSVHSRKKAMAAFQHNDDVDENKKSNYSQYQVILLSVESAASGANLNRATHVILVDPVPGSSSEAFAAERQAVGRAGRQGMEENTTKVIRFVVAGTIEEETHKRNEKMRRESAMEDECHDEAVKYKQMKSKLNKSLKIKRRNSEIEFYLNIKEETKKMEVEDKVKVEGEDMNATKGTKRRRPRRRRRGTRNEEKNEESPEDKELKQPPNKKRKVGKMDMKAEND